MPEEPRQMLDGVVGRDEQLLVPRAEHVGNLVSEAELVSSVTAKAHGEGSQWFGSESSRIRDERARIEAAAQESSYRNVAAQTQPDRILEQLAYSLRGLLSRHLAWETVLGEVPVPRH